jgi:hypothetical protein
LLQLQKNDNFQLQFSKFKAPVIPTSVVAILLALESLIILGRI